MTRLERPRSGWPLVMLAASGLLVAIYLTVVKLAGVTPICGPSGGCEAVETSAYADVAGVPIAAVGVLYSLVATGGALVWWRRSDVRALYVLYGLGLAGSLVEVYLVYLEVAVIHAVCIWCAAYGVTLVAGLVGTIMVLRRARASAARRQTDPDKGSSQALPRS
jgi:uncharacterized membrane protein